MSGSVDSKAGFADISVKLKGPKGNVYRIWIIRVGMYC